MFIDTLLVVNKRMNCLIDYQKRRLVTIILKSANNKRTMPEKNKSQPMGIRKKVS